MSPFKKLPELHVVSGDHNDLGKITAIFGEQTALIDWEDGTREFCDLSDINDRYDLFATRGLAMQAIIDRAKEEEASEDASKQVEG